MGDMVQITDTVLINPVKFSFALITLYSVSHCYCFLKFEIILVDDEIAEKMPV